jgi:GTP-binding protein
VVNKWDLVEGEAEQKQFTREVRRRLKFMPYVPVVYTSALHGKGVGDVLSAAGEVFESRQRRVGTSQLNSAMQDIMAGHAPPAMAGRKLKVLYATQAETNPPTFVFSVNDPALLHFSYQRYLENELRRRFDFMGTPLKLIFNRRSKK